MAARAAEPPAAWLLEDLEVQRLVLAHGTNAPLSFVVPAGEVVVVVGATGQGKSTLLRTLLGLEASRAGEVRYGSRSITHAPPGQAPRPFAWVPQDSPLLTDTLAANVLVAMPDGHPRATDGAAARALEAIGAGALAPSLGAQRLGAGGVEPSGGERQWIALARALVTAQPVLLLDEPTSGLDPHAQAAVLSAIGALRGSRSVLLVTHRREPLALAHTVVRLDEGRALVEAGPARLRQRLPRAADA